jgi:hypothetical protein
VLGHDPFKKARAQAVPARYDLNFRTTTGTYFLLCLFEYLGVLKV